MLSTAIGDKIDNGQQGPGSGTTDVECADGLLGRWPSREVLKHGTQIIDVNGLSQLLTGADDRHHGKTLYPVGEEMKRFAMTGLVIGVHGTIWRTGTQYRVRESRGADQGFLFGSASGVSVLARPPHLGGAAVDEVGASLFADLQEGLGHRAIDRASGGSIGLAGQVNDGLRVEGTERCDGCPSTEVDGDDLGWSVRLETEVSTVGEGDDGVVGQVPHEMAHHVCADEGRGASDEHGPTHGTLTSRQARVGTDGVVRVTRK